MLSAEMTGGFLFNLIQEKVKAMFLCAPAKDFMKDRFDEINQFPGEHIPIPGTYDHSTGMGGIPKHFLGQFLNFGSNQIHWISSALYIFYIQKMMNYGEEKQTTHVFKFV